MDRHAEKELDAHHLERDGSDKDQKHDDQHHRGSGRDGGIDVAQVLEQDPSAPTTGPLEKDDKETRRIMRKVDLRLLPVLATIYAFALIDRTNLPNARISGMDEDLELYIGDRYSIATMMFFIPYIIFQFPANIVIRKLGAAVWLSSLVIAWGGVTIGMGFLTDWTQLLGCRIILGVLEAGYFPGCVYLLSCWYVRYEVQKRFSAFYLLALLASGASNILAYGLSEMRGIGGLNGWQWIFAIEGAITMVLGIMGFIAIIDFPDKATRPNIITRRAFMTEHEARIVINRIQRDRGDAVVDKLTWELIFRHLRDWKLWEFAWLYMLNNLVSVQICFWASLTSAT